MVTNTANTVNKKAVTPIIITANTKYFLTVQANDWNEYTLDGTYSGDIMPVTNGSITIHRHGFNSGTDQDFPISFDTEFASGMVGFTFQPN